LKLDKKRIRKVTEDLITFLKLRDRDLSILFTDNKKIAKANKEFFGKDRPTNVISFSYIDGFDSEVFGDLIISVERVREEAEKAGISFYERLFALIIHGILHVIGHDHEKGCNESRRMRYRERKLLDYVTNHRTYQEIAL
jgi:rRNA maturation RNase YbeY